MTFSPPAIEPLSRLQVSQGLLITTERWQHAQTYHRQRQNLHYQSLNQPGIVRGFGVCVIPPPPNAKGKELQHLWVQISPGIAIDIEGNPIILQTPRNFNLNPLDLNLKQRSQPTVYLVAQHVDPDSADKALFTADTPVHESAVSTPDKIQESCRFVWRSQTKLQAQDVELCRVHLQPNHLDLKSATSVYFPERNALDFRHRLTAKARPQAVVRVGHLYSNEGDRAISQSTFSNLLQATAHRSQIVQGHPTVTEISTDQRKESLSNSQDVDPIFEALSDCQLTYVRYADLFSVLRNSHTSLRDYLKQGSVLLIEADAELQTLEGLQQNMQAALADLKTIDDSEKDQEFIKLRSQLNDTLTQVNTRIAQNITTICHQTKSFAEQINYPLVGEGNIGPSHPLRQVPFTFSNWPTDKQNPIRLFCWNGIILALGHLSQLWAPDVTACNSPQENRLAEEWGLNLLHYAWKHHQMTQLQQANTIHE